MGTFVKIDLDDQRFSASRSVPDAFLELYDELDLNFLCTALKRNSWFEKDQHRKKCTLLLLKIARSDFVSRLCNVKGSVTCKPRLDK